ncbi:MAG: hypothetical protein HYZ75_08145 [Elusimicrobia bacterium]|nr:hypothetical protein [Elusimicrobiota bacterium]
MKTLGLFGRYKTKVSKGGEDNEVLAVPGQYGKVMGIHITRGHSQARDGWMSGEFLILNADGETTLHLRDFNVPFLPHPSPSGDYLVAGPGPSGPGGVPRFYDVNGIRNQWARGDSKEHWPESHRVGEIVFSHDGSRVAIEAVKGDSYRSIVYDSRGVKQWELPVRGAVMFSPSSSELALVAETRLYFFGSDGRELRAFDIPGIGPWSLGRYSKDGKQLVLTTNTNKLILVEVQSGKTLWESLPSKAPSVESLGVGVRLRLAGLDASSGLEKIAVAGVSFRSATFDAGGGQTGTRKEHLRSHVFLYDHAGMLLDELSLPTNSFLFHGPNIASIGVSGDGKELFVPTTTEILTYSVADQPR